MAKDLNILINGVGGQGAITLKKILAYAATKENKKFVAAEVHGLAQKGGSVNVHFRVGNKAFSPLISLKKADLIISLDLLEGARTVNFANKDTVYVVNDFFNIFYQLPKFSNKEFLKVVSKITKNINLIPANDICQKELGNAVFEGVFLLGVALAMDLLPFKGDSMLYGIEKAVPTKYVKQNKKAFEMGYEYGRRK